jgi:hypothetical protein
LQAQWETGGRRFEEARADFEFLIGALSRLRKAVALAGTIEGLAAPISDALAEFDARLPTVRELRNIGEHVDEHALGPRWAELEGASWTGEAFHWLGSRVSLVEAQRASTELFVRLRECASSVGEAPDRHVTEPG